MDQQAQTPKAKEKLSKAGSFLLLRQGEKEKTKERFLPKALSRIDTMDIYRISGIRNINVKQVSLKEKAEPAMENLVTA